MYLSELNIKGYKIFKSEFNIKLNEDLTVLIGENGCGKTAIIDAIRLLLSEDEFGRIGISESHFHRPLDKPARERGEESIEVNGIFRSLSDIEQSAYLPWLDANDNTKAYLHKKIDNKQNNRGWFNHITWGGESVTGIFEWELINAISCIYLPPLRDAESKLEAIRGSRLSRLFRKDKPKRGEPKHNIEEKFEAFNKDLLDDTAISSVNTAIKKYLKESLGNVLGQDAIIQFAETSFDRIVERLRLLFYPKIESSTKAELFRDVSENSMGYNNILYLATVLAELERLEEQSTIHKILLIEEPEAHLHTQLQIKLLQYLKEQSKKSKIQVIVTTHSATISASCGLNAINVITVKEDGIPTSSLIANINLEPDSLFFLERWLDITKSTLFFSKGILFVEGIAEALVIKELAKKVIKAHNNGEESSPTTLEDYGVSIINLNGIYFKHFMPLFQGYELDKNGEPRAAVTYVPLRCAGITDCDPQPVKESIPTSGNPCECGNSQSRDYAKELIEKGSEHCRIFTNLKTFEYDLALEGNNLRTMYSVIYKGYKNKLVEGAKEAKAKSEDDWSAKSEKERAEESFQLLTKIEDSGKGEFAQKLAYFLASGAVTDFLVPKYIEDAIIWVTKMNTKET